MSAIQARVKAEGNVISDKVKEMDLYWNSKKPYKSDTLGGALNIIFNAKGI